MSEEQNSVEQAVAPSDSQTPETPPEDTYKAHEAARRAARRGVAPEPAAEPKPEAESSGGDSESQTETESPPVERSQTTDDEFGPEPKNPQQKANWKALREAKQRAEREAAELRARLAERPAQTKPEPAQQPQPEKPPAPKEFDKPYPELENFKSVEEHRKATLEWAAEMAEFKAAERVETEFRRRTEAEQRREIERQERERQESVRTRFNTEVSELKDHADYGDFDEVIASATDDDITPAMYEFFTQEDGGARTAYHVLGDRAERERIAKLPPTSQVIALSRIRDEVMPSKSEATTEDEPESKPEPKKAEPEPKRVRGSAPSGKRGTAIEASQKGDYRTFEQRRRRERAERRGQRV